MEKLTQEKLVNICKQYGYIFQGSEIYGGLANLVILLLWFYLLAYIFVVGIALNYREEASKLQDTTRIKIIKTDNLKK